jgi:hypothetical protein
MMNCSINLILILQMKSTFKFNISQIIIGKKNGTFELYNLETKKFENETAFGNDEINYIEFSSNVIKYFIIGETIIGVFRKPS